jgi:hypothetical protein
LNGRNAVFGEDHRKKVFLIEELASPKKEFDVFGGQLRRAEENFGRKGRSFEVLEKKTQN